jgi:hypothetical protein
MKSQIKLGTVFGVELRLHYSWLVIALLITFAIWGNHARRRSTLCLQNSPTPAMDCGVT